MWFDPAVVEAVQNLFLEWATYLFAALSYLGSIWFVAPVAVVAYWFGDRYRFGPWLAAAIGIYAVMIGLKELFFIPRPGVGPAISADALPTAVALLYAPAVEAGTTTFPSGHALAATVVWTMLAIETDIGSPRIQYLGAITMILLVGFSRIATGLHYPIDVVAGIAVGIGYLLGLLGHLRWAAGYDLLGDSRSGSGLPTVAPVRNGGVEATGEGGETPG